MLGHIIAGSAAIPERAVIRSVGFRTVGLVIRTAQSNGGVQPLHLPIAALAPSGNP